MTLTAAVVLILSSTPTPAQKNVVGASADASPAKVEKKICRAREDSSTSRLVKKTCRTRTEWQALSQADAGRAMPDGTASGK